MQYIPEAFWRSESGRSKEMLWPGEKLEYCLSVRDSAYGVHPLSNITTVCGDGEVKGRIKGYRGVADDASMTGCFSGDNANTGATNMIHNTYIDWEDLDGQRLVSDTTIDGDAGLPPPIVRNGLLGGRWNVATRKIKQ